MFHRFRNASLVIGLASAFLLASAVGCGNASSTAKPSNPAAKPNNESKESRPPNPDPG